MPILEKIRKCTENQFQIHRKEMSCGIDGIPKHTDMEKQLISQGKK
jgi:hypothetical protein